MAAEVAVGGTLVYENHDLSCKTILTPPVSPNVRLRLPYFYDRTLQSSWHFFSQALDSSPATVYMPHQHIKYTYLIEMANDLVEDIEQIMLACKSERPYNSLLDLNGKARPKLEPTTLLIHSPGSFNVDDFVAGSKRPSESSSMRVSNWSRNSGTGEPQPRDGETGEGGKGSRGRYPS